MKVLLTGSTAAQVSASKNASVLTFTGLVNRALLDGGHSVTWIEPSVNMSKAYLSEFDSVVVGMAPPTSTAAHRIYGTLSVINYARDLGTLRLMLDAPEPKRVWAGIRTAYNKPDDLVKEFHSKRREYKEALAEEVLPRLQEAVGALYTEQWPTTIYPSFPWMSAPSVSTYVPQTGSSNLVGLNLDSKILQTRVMRKATVSEYWVVDSMNTKWTKGVEKTLGNDLLPLHESRWQSDAEAVERLRRAVGCLVSMYRYGDPWWTPALSQSLHVGTPVVTDWRLSSYLGPSWGVLAGVVEDLSPEERLTLSDQQFRSYIEHIPTWDDAVELTCNSVFN